MKLSQMRYFSAVCHLGSVTQAAEQLHISQPAITAAIQALDGGESLFFSHYDPKTVEWFMSIL